ncbi:sensor histidine kinase [Streptomyces sp. GbtcB6]|uniref:sensor histidine kinase n=1 Tax=Streptomyces sp. GbtcB6 TaxID=2824751 RepID=UPI001C305E8F|nr:sensor histidine kinase [Streptomyces sp. GbtcB6]
MSTPWQRYAEEHTRTVDTMAAVLLFALFLFGSEITMSAEDQPHAAGLTIALAAVGCGALLWQRTRPRTVVALGAAATAAAAGLGHLPTPLLLGGLMLALYRLAVDTDRPTARRYYFASVALVVGAAMVFAPAGIPWPLETISPAAWLLLPVVAGNAVRLQTAYLDAVQARAEYAERSREEEARHRVAEERMRIARELHDVVAHHLALANAQAGTAAHLSRTHPDQVHRILGDLAGTTASALRELKATVGLLRQTGDPDLPLAPSPGLDRLPELTEACESAGLAVHVSVEGSPRPLTAGVDLTAYRIVQEALTNVTKHASAEAAYVRIGWARDRLTLTITDDGTATAPAAPAPGHGFGLIGMRERAQSVGGAFAAGHRDGGGYEVTTRLPLYPSAPGATEPEEQGTP